MVFFFVVRCSRSFQKGTNKAVPRLSWLGWVVARGWEGKVWRKGERGT